jgi:ParB family transcriptional regulator, chromosome partitioning protein
VRRVGDRYELIAGERRWRAVERAGLETIWAVERDATDVESFKLALVENLHREELSHAETVAALDQLAELS